MRLPTHSQWGPLVFCLAAFGLIGYVPTGAACYTHCCLQGLKEIEDAGVSFWGFFFCVSCHVEVTVTLGQKCM